MLKRKIDKAAYDALPDALKAYYQTDGEGYGLKLEVSADDDPAELRRARDREKQNAADEKARADRLQASMDTLIADPNKQKDIQTLEASWKQKLVDKEKDLNKKIERLTENLKKILVLDRAKLVAQELAGDNADLLVPHIEARLSAEVDGDTAATRVLDATGQLSAASVDDLKKEFLANKKFSAILVASRASGGASGSRAGNGTISAVPSGKKFNELTERERVEWHKSDPEAFKQALEAHREVSARRF